MKEEVTKKEVTVEEVRDFVSRMRRKANNNGTRCVDGGYSIEDANGFLAKAGGDLGTSMALLALGFSPREAFDYVFQFCQSENRPYCWHTDTHEGHDSVCGCGHCNAAITNGIAINAVDKFYQVSPQSVKDLLDIVREEQAKRENENTMLCVTLNRDHNERAILKVTGTKFTLNPWDIGKHEQFFIYDETRDKEMMHRLCEMLVSLDVQVDEDDLLKASGAQILATLGLLKTSRGAQIFEVNCDDESDWDIKEIGNAPDHTK